MKSNSMWDKDCPTIMGTVLAFTSFVQKETEKYNVFFIQTTKQCIIDAAYILCAYSVTYGWY